VSVYLNCQTQSLYCTYIDATVQSILHDSITITLASAATFGSLLLHRIARLKNTQKQKHRYGEVDIVVALLLTGVRRTSGEAI